MTFVWHIPCCCELDQRLYCEGPAVADDLERLLVALRPKPSLLKKKLQKKKPQHATIPVEELARQRCCRLVKGVCYMMLSLLPYLLHGDLHLINRFIDHLTTAVLVQGKIFSLLEEGRRLPPHLGSQRTDSVRV